MRRDGWPEYYAFDSGTSLSAPHVAGAIALLWALWPELTSDQIKDALYSTARKDAFTGATPNSRWGYGKLDVGAAYELLSKPKGTERQKMNKQTFKFQLTLRSNTGQRTPVTVQIDLDGDQVVGIRGLNASGTEAYDVSFKVRKRKPKAVAAEGALDDPNIDDANGGDECFECQKPNTPCPPNDLVEVPCT